jgi:hypothetical protein
MPEYHPTELSELRSEITRLRQALWEVLVAVDELAYVVEFSREQEVGTKSVVEAIDRARDILSKEQPLAPRPRAQKMRR